MGRGSGKDQSVIDPNQRGIANRDAQYVTEAGSVVAEMHDGDVIQVNTETDKADAASAANEGENNLYADLPTNVTVPIESSAINSVYYDDSAEELSVIFNSNLDQRYIYHDVPIETFADLLEADSQGSYIAQNIRNEYDHSVDALAGPDDVDVSGFDDAVAADYDDVPAAYADSDQDWSETDNDYSYGQFDDYEAGDWDTSDSTY